MIVEKREINRGMCILVAIQLNRSNGGELLHWAISELAKSGDRVVAVYVCREQDICSKTTMTLIKVLDDYLVGFESLRSLKKVFLVGRIAVGNSIKKVIVNEASIFTAMSVVIGVQKTGAFRVSSSLTRYCAKKLPPTTALYALHNGKLVFERRRAAKVSSKGLLRPIHHNASHSSIGMEPNVLIPSFRFNPQWDVSCFSKFDVGYGAKSIVDDDDDDDGEDVLELDQMVESNSSSISFLVRKLPQKSLGWPLLHRAEPDILKEAAGKAGFEARKLLRKLSVVQWAMNLPDRTLFPAVQSSHISQNVMPKSENFRRSASLGTLKATDRIVEKRTTCCKWYKYDELRSSTNQFSSENLIGKGGSSQVYKGYLTDGQKVAVKVSKLSDKMSENFLSEVNIIASLNHRHILPLLGISITDNNLISVYNYFPNGSLEENLHGKRSKPPLTWEVRYKVALGICEALAYLHTCHPWPVIHRDVKSSNILLSNDFEPQLSDFGLAVWSPKTMPCQMHCDVVGTFGYLAPEYFMHGKVSHKIDIYAFGVVLLELLTGRKPINNKNPKGKENLVVWAAPLLERGEMTELLDPNLQEKHVEEEVLRMALAASLCINRTAALRPESSQVLRLLQGKEEIQAWMEVYEKTQNEILDYQEKEDESCIVGRSFRSRHVGLALLDIDDGGDDGSGIFGHRKSVSWQWYLKEHMRHRTSGFED